jgi:tRNA(Glu) U13 pseudouridine synthase TruD
VLSSFDVDAEHLAKIKKIAKGARRPLRVQVANQVMEVGADHVGDFVELKFELPAGSYATVVIDKLLRGDV